MFVFPFDRTRLVSIYRDDNQNVGVYGFVVFAKEVHDRTAIVEDHSENKQDRIHHVVRLDRNSQRSF